MVGAGVEVVSPVAGQTGGVVTAEGTAYYSRRTGHARVIGQEEQRLALETYRGRTAFAAAEQRRRTQDAGIVR